MSSSGEENCSQSRTMQFLEAPKPHEQPSVSTPSTSNVPSNPPASPSQPLIASNPSPPRALMASNSSPPPVPQPPTMNPPFQALSTPTPRRPPPQRFANYDDSDRYFNSFPPGYRFRPYDHELVLHYLDKKVKGLPLPMNRIINADLYQFDPEDLAAQYSHHGEKEWYFFTPRNRKYKNGTRPNRAAGGGYWKATGADKGITYEKRVIEAGNKITYQKTLVGHRKALVYYAGKPPKGDKTNWIMHEFRLDDSPLHVRNNRDDMRLDDCVLCRIYKKREKKSTNASTNVRNRQSNEENPLLTIDDDDEDYINDHDYDPNHLSAIEASFAGEIYGMVTNSLENSFPILDELSQQQTGTSIFPDANNFFMFQDSQIPGLEETFGTPAPMDSVNPEDWSSEQMGLQDEFLNPTYSSPFNIPDHFFNLYSIMPTNLPMNPSPLVNICPMNTAPIRSLPPMNTAPSTGDLPPINTDPLAAPFPPANSQPTSEMMNAAPNHPGQPPQHR
ncbi:hypothetical protein H0E87_001580 [Populus deltoides]|uniref:NAC domain-containing protein n=1 Tax=Populus deltoides TaxID=3696 RepID=A0A8T2ZRY3_POPDE|nr:hypothetical protein H0E87_001580 [Populus deltoides]